ncbi:MAG: hypothetical protein ABR975_11210 [Vulcanimicrobiaceae bacterium]
MTDEVLFYERFLADVRRCAPGRRSAVLEVGRRVRAALLAPADERDRRWSFVVAALRELLVVVADRESAEARRLRAFLRENDDLNVARDLAVTDVMPRLYPAGILVGARGTYLLLEVGARAARHPTPVRHATSLAQRCALALFGTVLFWLAVALPQ